MTALLAIPSIANAPIVIASQNTITEKASEVATLTESIPGVQCTPP